MRNISSTNLKVSSIGFGGMQLSIDGRPNEEIAIQVIQQAVDSGITFFDTADVYCLDHTDIGHNEKLFAKALKGVKNIVIATKGGLERPNGDWTVNADPEHLQHACEASLRALGVEQIQLYQLHAPDPNVPFEHSVEKLSELQRDGKINFIGLSNVTVDEIQRAREIVEIVSVQNRCNIFDLTALHSGVIEYCANNNIAFIPYSPFAGKYHSNRIGAEPLLLQIGAKYNASPYQIALAWLLSKGQNIIPIPAARSVEHVKDFALAINLNLQLEDLAIIDKNYN